MDDQLVLYMLKGCPYCQKAKDFMDENNMEVPIKYIGQDEQARQKLIEGGGKQQVPCLFVGEKVIYESDDIIEWMKNNLLS